MKHAQLTGKGFWIDTNLDASGRYWSAWKPHTSRSFRDSKQLLKWLAWPIKTPTGDAIRAWIAEVQAVDAAPPTTDDTAQT
jgi:hypothetical protein